MTTRAVPIKELRPGEKRDEDGSTLPAWDLYLDGGLVASGYTSLAEAQMELDLIAWFALFGEAPLSPGALITDEALGIALTVFNRLFTTTRVQEKARTALNQIIRTGIFTIQPDGSLSVLASSSRGRQSAYAVTTRTTRDDDAPAGAYQVTMECECRDFYTRAHEHGGICKHVAARLLLFLAQRGVAHLKHLRDALDTQGAVERANAAPAEAEPAPAAGVSDAGAMAFLSIAATDLTAALFLAARFAASIELRIADGALSLLAEAGALTVPGAHGEGSAAVQLDVDAVTALYDQVRPARATAGVITIFVDPADGSVYLCGEDESLAITAQGTPIGPAPTPADEPHSDAQDAAPLAALDAAPARDALQMLFELLEAHEPEWYLRKHHRLASAALHSALHPFPMRSRP